MIIADALEKTREKIEAACRRSGRKIEDVNLMAVSKFQPRTAIDAAIQAGLDLFGESRVQEASGKFPLKTSGARPYRVHLIGSLQRNKVRASLDLFDCIQSVDRPELLIELEKRAESGAVPLDILLELHCGEESKAGFPNLDALLNAIDLALSLQSVRIQGLMTMAPYVQDEKIIRSAFRKLCSAQAEINKRFPQVSCSVLSMGMSNDFEIAVEEGSTLLRIGTALFGAATT